MGTSLGFVPYITTLRAICGEFAICFCGTRKVEIYVCRTLLNVSKHQGIDLAR